jgi:hypothetical protein
MGTKTKDQIRNEIAIYQSVIANERARLASAKEKNIKEQIRGNIAYHQGKIASLKAQLKNAPK